MTKKVLLLSPFFHPEPISTGKYNSFLAKALADKGLGVDVLCFHPLYPDWRPHISDEDMDGIGIIRGGSWIRYPKNDLLRRMILEIGFILHLLRHIRIIKKYPIIVAVTPPILSLSLVHTVAPKTRVTAIVHDLQGIMAAVGLNVYRFNVIGLIRFLEGKILRRCHRVIALSQSMASFLQNTYKVPPSSISTCRPFVTINTRSSGARLKHLFAKHKIHVVYAGALGKKQNPEGLISFFHHLVNRRSDIICHIFSRGPIFETYRRNPETVHTHLCFHDLVAEDDLYELYLRSHIQVIPEKIGFSNGAVPSKLPNLLAAGVPILYIGEKNSDIRQFIDGANAGQCAHSWDIKHLHDLIDRLILEITGGAYDKQRRNFPKKYASLFSVDTVIKEILP
jgi:glycosyltransferase involved in cell wall biosynthesis